MPWILKQTLNFWRPGLPYALCILHQLLLSAPPGWRRQFSWIWVRFLLTVSLILPFQNFQMLGPGPIFTVTLGLDFLSQCPAGQDWEMEERKASGRGDMVRVLALGELDPHPVFYRYLCICLCIYERKRECVCACTHTLSINRGRLSVLLRAYAQIQTP